MILATFAATLLTAFSDDSIYNNVEYPLPSVPDSIHLPRERAEYATAHFWDTYEDYGQCITDICCMQQAIANFAALARISENDETTAISVKNLVEKAKGTAKAAGILSSAAEICLDDIESPVYDRELYATFIKAFAHTDGLPKWIQTKYATLENLIAMNAVGSKAADFTILLPSGEKTTLWEEVGHEYTILILYDPECSHCDITMKQLSTEPILDKWITADMAKVVAADIRPSENSKEKSASLPENWVRGTDATGIEEEEIYYVPATPSIYLLDANGTVLLKDAAPADALEAIWTGKK